MTGHRCTELTSLSTPTPFDRTKPYPSTTISVSYFSTKKNMKPKWLYIHLICIPHRVRKKRFMLPKAINRLNDWVYSSFSTIKLYHVLKITVYSDRLVNRLILVRLLKILRFGECSNMCENLRVCFQLRNQPTSQPITNFWTGLSTKTLLGTL